MSSNNQQSEEIVAVLRQALEALEHAAECVQNNYCPAEMGHDWDEQIQSLRQAIADAENQYAAKASELAHLSDRLQINPKTGNVSIGSKEAIAEAEKQEPEGWLFRFPTSDRWHYTPHAPHDRSKPELTWKAIYTHQQQKRVPLTEVDYANACLSYRHDFGLMTQEKRDKLMFQAKEWAQAFGIKGEA